MLGYAVLIAVVGLVYLLKPRLAAATLTGLGALGCVATGLALVSWGTVPWLLVAFWGSSAVLLAGLLDYIGRGGPDRLSSVTVGAVASLLMLSSVGLGEYVRMNWSSAERAMLESVPLTPAPASGPRLMVAPHELEQAPDGKWAAHWTVWTADPVDSWSSVRSAVLRDGWTIFAEKKGRELRARKDSFDLTVIAEKTANARVGPGAETSATSGAAGWYVSMAAYVSGGIAGQQ